MSRTAPLLCLLWAACAPGLPGRVWVSLDPLPDQEDPFCEAVFAVGPVGIEGRAEVLWIEDCGGFTRTPRTLCREETPAGETWRVEVRERGEAYAPPFRWQLVGRELRIWDHDVVPLVQASAFDGDGWAVEATLTLP